MKAAQRQFLVTVSGVEGTFMTKTGGDVSASATKVYDGGSLNPEVLASPAEASDLTVTRGFDPVRDPIILADLRQRVGRFRSTVSVTPTDQDLIAIGDPVVYPDALLIGLSDPEANAASGDLAVMSLTFSIAGWR